MPNELRRCAKCGRPRDNKGHESLCPICLLDQPASEETFGVGHAVCQRFTGKREWGIGPLEPWRRCVTCNWPKAQHELPSCISTLSVKGESFHCDLNEPHDGWAHSNKQAQAVWQ